MRIPKRKPHQYAYLKRVELPYEEGSYATKNAHVKSAEGFSPSSALICDLCQKVVAVGLSGYSAIESHRGSKKCQAMAAGKVVKPNKKKTGKKHVSSSDSAVPLAVKARKRHSLQLSIDQILKRRSEKLDGIGEAIPSLVLSLDKDAAVAFENALKRALEEKVKEEDIISEVDVDCECACGLKNFSFTNLHVSSELDIFENVTVFLSCDLMHNSFARTRRVQFSKSIHDYMLRDDSPSGRRKGNGSHAVRRVAHIEPPFNE